MSESKPTENVYRFPFGYFFFGAAAGIGVSLLLYLFYLIQVNSTNAPEVMQHILVALSWAFGLMITILIVIVGLTRFDIESKMREAEKDIKEHERWQQTRMDRFEDRIVERATSDIEERVIAFMEEIAARKVEEYLAPAKQEIIDFTTTKLDEVKMKADDLSAKIDGLLAERYRIQELDMEGCDFAIAGKYAEAITLFSRIVEDRLATDSQRCRANINWGHCLQGLGDEEAACAHFLIAMSIFPQDFSICLEAAKSYIRQGRYESALSLLGKASETNRIDASAKMAEVFLYMGRGEESENAISSVIGSENEEYLESAATYIVLAASQTLQLKKSEALYSLQRQEELSIDPYIFDLENPRIIFEILRVYADDLDFKSLLDRVKKKLLPLQKLCRY